MAPEDIAEALSQQREDCVDTTSLSSCDDSHVDTGDNESRSGGFEDTPFELDSSK
jgi:hypothetical protein